MFLEFIQGYGMEIIGTLFTAILGYVGIVAKKLFERYIDNETKERVAKTVVGAVEQLYSDLDGEEKYNKAIENIAQMLDEKGIIGCSELEINMLIENAVNQLKIKFKK